MMDFVLKMVDCVFKMMILMQMDRDGNTAHGVGSISFPSGDRYEGQFAQGALGPAGKYFSAEGWSYSGEWDDGEMQVRSIKLRIHHKSQAICQGVLFTCLAAP